MDEPQPTPPEESAAARSGRVRVDPTLAIYGAVLGRPPTIDPDLARADRGVEVRLHVGLNVKLGGTHRSPYHAPTWRDKVGQWAADKVRDLDAARRRMIGMRTPNRTRAAVVLDAKTQAVVTVEAGTRRRTQEAAPSRAA